MEMNLIKIDNSFILCTFLSTQETLENHESNFICEQIILQLFPLVTLSLQSHCQPDSHLIV